MSRMNPTRRKAPANSITRRAFGRDLTSAAAGVLISRRRALSNEKQSPVILVQGSNRLTAIESAIESLGGIDCQGRDVYIKGSYNSHHPFPATTHPDALAKVVQILRKSNSADITLVERSGMGTAGDIWRRLGIVELAGHAKVRLLSLDDLPAGDWRHEGLPGSHWKNGVEVPRILGPDRIWVQICNLKTHRFGGHFSASLKNTIGLIAKFSHNGPRYNYMAELHASPDQRLMIAEVNQLYQPALLVMDATEVFASGGPESGEIASPGVVAASRDRVALDAVGLALLRLQSPASSLSRGPIFEEDQLKRAAELGLGAKSASEIEIRTADRLSSNLALQIKGVLSQTSAENKRQPPR